jgi:hypothetical protein
MCPFVSCKLTRSEPWNESTVSCCGRYCAIEEPQSSSEAAANQSRSKREPRLSLEAAISSHCKVALTSLHCAPASLQDVSWEVGTKQMQLLPCHCPRAQSWVGPIPILTVGEAAVAAQTHELKRACWETLTSSGMSSATVPSTIATNTWLELHLTLGHTCSHSVESAHHFFCGRGHRSSCSSNVLSTRNIIACFRAAP